MIVVSLFDGMSCGYQALKNAGIKISEYHAFEIDEYAIAISKKNHPDIIHHGSVVGADFSKFKNVDLLIGGSPCQGFSFAGKQLAFDDPRSKLFFEFIRAKNEIKPKNFLLENVRMKQEFLDVITRLTGVVPVLINSSLVSAQNRWRYYWCNWDIKEPNDRNILLKDIIENEVDDKFYFNERLGKSISGDNALNKVRTSLRSENDKARCLTAGGQAISNAGATNLIESFVDRDKSFCIDANYHKGGNLEQYFEKNRRQLVFSKPIKLGHFNSGGQGDRFYSIEGKSVCLSALGGGGGAKTGLYAIAQKGRNIIDVKRKDITSAKTEQRYETDFKEKSNTITSVQKDSLLLELQKGDYKIRRLTPIECERLQTLPDSYSEGVSNTQRYRMLGNGWTVAVITELFEQLYSPLTHSLCR